MDITEALRAYLLAAPAVAALVGERVFVTVAPQEAEKPLVVLRKVSGARVYSQSGDSGLAWPRVEITARAERAADAIAVATAVRQAISGYRGMMGAVNVQAVFVDSERDAFDFETRAFERVVDIFIWHTDA